MENPKEVFKKIEEKKFPFSEISPYQEKSLYYSKKEFQRCKELFQKRIGNFETTSTLELYRKWIIISKQIETEEYRHKDELENLAINAIKTLYNIPKEIILEPKLTTFQKTCNYNFVDNKIETKIKKNLKLQNEINKQIVLNGFIHGSSIKIWTSIYYLVKNDLKKINPNLLELYNKYSALTSITFWVNPIDKMVQKIKSGQAMSQGNCSVENKTTIKSVGNNFPVLLHELNKGVITFLTLHGFPRNFTEQELDYILFESSPYYHEIWHYILSPTLWSDLLNKINIMPEEIPQIIMNLSKKTYDELKTLLK